MGKTTKMIKLHYAELNSENIEETEHVNIMPLAYYFLTVAKESKKCVYLLSFSDEVNRKDLTFVSEHLDFIADILRNTHLTFDCAFAKDVFIQEYESFEEAYKSALEMKEISPLCYSE